MDAAVDDLLTQVLLWDDGEALNPVAGAREVAGPGPGETGPPLEMTVGSLSAARRMDLAADLGLPAPPDTDAAIDAIVDLLRDADHVRTLLEGAPGGGGRAARAAGLGHPGRHGRAGRPRGARRGRGLAGRLAAGPRPARRPRPPHGRAAARGRAWRCAAAGRSRAWRGSRRRCRRPTTRRRWTAAHVDRSAAAQADAAVRLVEDLLEGWSVDPPPVLKSGGLGVRDLRRVATRLDVEEWQAALLAETAYAAGLLGAGGAVETEWLPTPAYDRWRTDGVADRWVALVEAWLSSTRVAGLVGGRDDRDKVVAALGPDVERWVAAQVRVELLRLLASVPPGTVLPAERLDLALAWARPRQSWGLRSALVGWTLREAELLGVTGAGALSSAGRALAATPAVSGDESRRAAAWADAVADALDPLLPRPVDHVLLQADLTAVAPGPLVPSLARALAMAADVESTGGATVYRFTPASVRRALDAGQTADDLHTLLATHSRTPVPQPLTYLVDDLARRHGRIRVGTAGAYVRCDDTAVLDELVALSGSRAGDLRLRRIAPTVLTTPTSPDVLLARLRELGYAPAAESADGAVITRRPDARRAPQTGARSRPVGGLAGGAGGPGAPAPALLEAAVRAMRAGDRASRAPRGAVVEGMAATGAVPRTAAASTLGLLRLAIEEARPVWIGYVDTHGGVTERVVDPVRLGGGYLTAYDHRSRAGAHVRRAPDHRRGVPGRRGLKLSRPCGARLASSRDGAGPTVAGARRVVRRRAAPRLVTEHRARRQPGGARRADAGHRRVPRRARRPRPTGPHRHAPGRVPGAAAAGVHPMDVGRGVLRLHQRALAGGHDGPAAHLPRAPRLRGRPLEAPSRVRDPGARTDAGGAGDRDRPALGGGHHRPRQRAVAEGDRGQRRGVRRPLRAGRGQRWRAGAALPGRGAPAHVVTGHRTVAVRAAVTVA